MVLDHLWFYDVIYAFSIIHGPIILDHIILSIVLSS